MSTVKRENKLFWKRIAISIVLIFVFLSACNLPWKRFPSEPLQTTETEIPVTPKARLDLPPTLIESTPIPGSEISLSGEITFTFNQAMNKASVEGAIQGFPALSGFFSWEDDTTVTFIPDRPFMSNSDLEITITVNAKAANG
ncbi:MAG: Ig-like domain-containing protein, partial [Chloroflexota bacterium]